MGRSSRGPVGTILVGLLLLNIVQAAVKKNSPVNVKDLEAQEKSKNVYKSLRISDDDLTRMNEEGEPVQPPRLTAGDEYVDERKPEEMTDDYEQGEHWYQQGLKFIERGRPKGEEGRRAAYQLFDRAAGLGHYDSKKLMGFAHLFGDRARWSLDEARETFKELAGRGSPDGQLGLGFLYATGLGVPKSSQGHATVYYSFAAMGGSPLAQMAMGYRHLMGVGAKKSCEEALFYYENAATQVADRVRFSTSVSLQRVRLTDELEPTSTSPVPSTPMDQNMLEYYRFLADKGDVSAQLGLGQLFLSGGRGIEQNFDEAHRYLTSAAEAGNAAAYAYLGKMYLDGTVATPQDNTTAFHFFLKSADKLNQIGQAGLGVMYLQGRGVRRDYEKAFHLFSLSAEQGWVDGQLYLGVMHYQGLGTPRDVKQAVKFFQLATQNGHILAFYNLAHMHSTGVGVLRNCETAVEFYKNVAERGRWTERMMEAYTAYKDRRTDEAALKYLFLSELGYEQAQTNFAYILDRDEARGLYPYVRQEVLKTALVHWNRAASQDYMLARVKLGDYYYYGYGTEPDYAQAAHHYKIAAERHLAAQAMFNLGYMHEKGEGLAQDVFLAKRYYDQAAETSPDAFVPSTLAVAKLAIVYVFLRLTQSPWGETLSAFENWDLVAMVLTGAGMVYLLILMVRRNNAAADAAAGNDHQHQD